MAGGGLGVIKGVIRRVKGLVMIRLLILIHEIVLLGFIIKRWDIEKNPGNERFWLRKNDQ